jgi:hypothetical protein
VSTANEDGIVNLKATYLGSCGGGFDVSEGDGLAIGGGGLGGGGLGGGGGGGGLGGEGGGGALVISMISLQVNRHNEAIIYIHTYIYI